MAVCPEPGSAEGTRGRQKLLLEPMEGWEAEECPGPGCQQFPAFPLAKDRGPRALISPEGCGEMFFPAALQFCCHSPGRALLPLPLDLSSPGRSCGSVEVAG